MPEEGTDFKILTASGGVSGTFNQLYIPNGFPLEVIYKSNEVHLYVLSGSSIVERSVATDDLNAAIFTTWLLGVSIEELLPRMFGSIKDILFNATNTQYAQVTNRLGAIRAGATGLFLQGLSKEPMEETFSKRQIKNDKAYEQADISRWDIFASASGIFSKINNVNDLPKINSITGNFNVGTDCSLNEYVNVGAYAGYQGSKAWYSDGSWLRSNGVKFGIYGTSEWKGFYLNALVGGGANLFNLNRSIDIRKYHWTASSSPFVGELDSLLGGGYEFNIGAWRLGANTSIQYTYLGISPLNEFRAGNLNTRVERQTPSSLVSTVGGNISYIWEMKPNYKIIPTIGLAWQHEFLNYGQNLNGRFVNGNGAPFNFSSPTGARNNAFGFAGITAQLGPKFGASLYYNPQFGGGQIFSQALFAGINYNF